ncbi:MAG: transposase [Methylovirgula sp.]
MRDALILYAARDCASCSLKPRCTNAERRFVTRHLHEDALERMNARFQADPSLIRQRRCASEHPFGTIKRMTAGGRSSPAALRKSAGKQR